MAASHGLTDWTCKAPGHAADLARLRSARRGLHRDLVGAVQGHFINLCLKGLNKTRERAGDKHTVGVARDGINPEL